MTMILRNMAETANGMPILGTPYVGLLAEDIIAETTLGEDGPGAMFNDGLTTGKRYKLVIQHPDEFVGTAYENGSFYAVAPTSATYVLYEDNIEVSGVWEILIGDLGLQTAGKNARRRVVAKRTTRSSAAAESAELALAVFAEHEDRDARDIQDVVLALFTLEEVF